MRGHGLIWHISGCPNFSFDTDNDLAAYLKQYDHDGSFSSLSMSFATDDPRINTLTNICKEVIAGFTLYKPLYDVMVWRSKIIENKSLRQTL